MRSDKRHVLSGEWALLRESAMKSILCFLVVGWLSVAVRAGEDAPRAGPAKLKPPKYVTLTPEQERLLDDANAAVEKSYTFLIEKHEPGQAVEELRKAVAIMNQLEALKPDKAQLAGVAPGNEKGTPFDEIKTAGGIEKIVEIGAAIGVTAPDEVDTGLHKRKIIEDAKETARKIDAEQKQVTLDLQSRTGRGGEENRPQQQQAQEHIQQEGGQEQANRQNQGQQQANQQNQGQQGQEQAGAPAGQPSQGQPGQQQANEQNQGQPEQQQPNQALAGKEDAIARELNKLASKMAEAGAEQSQANQAHQSFRKAAAEAAKTADLIRQDQIQGAAAASRQTERAIQDALREAGLAGESSLAAAVSAIENQISKLQAGQHDIQDKAQQLGKSADGTPAPERLKQGRATTLAVEQGKLKPQLEDVQRELDDLARSSSAGEPAKRSAENAARSELAAASVEMQKNRPKQAVVNAAMKLAQGETAAATKAMSQVQSTLDAAQQRVAAADAALASGDASRLESAYRAVQQLAASARRLEQTALNAAAQQGQEQANRTGQPGEQAAGKTGENQPGKPAQPEAQAKGDKPGEQTAGKPGTEPQGQRPPEAQTAAGAPRSATESVSASWGQVLNKTAEQLGEETGRAAKRLGNIAPEVGQQLGATATGTKTEFERDFPASLGQVRKLLTALEKAEQVLGARVAQEKENKAMRNYRKEDIPRGYRQAVAAYYEELAKEEKK